MNTSDAIQILRKHNTSGASVLRITKGKVTEHELLACVLNACEQFIAEREGYKRLLKAAVEDVETLAKAFTEDEPCGSFTLCLECPLCIKEGCSCKEWRYKAEALKLIGDETV